MTVTTNEEPHLVPVNEAAVRLHRHPVTLRANFRAGDVPGIRIGGRWFMSSAVLDRILSGELNPGASKAS